MSFRSSRWLTGTGYSAIFHPRRRGRAIPTKFASSMMVTSRAKWFRITRGVGGAEHFSELSRRVHINIGFLLSVLCKYILLIEPNSYGTNFENKLSW